MSWDWILEQLDKEEAESDARWTALVSTVSGDHAPIVNLETEKIIPGCYRSLPRKLEY